MNTSTPSKRKIDRLAASIAADVKIKDIAARAGVSTKTIRRWIAAGTCPPPDIRFSQSTHRWRRSTIDEFFEKGPQTN